MTKHDPFKELSETLKKMPENFDQKFNDLTFDMKEIMTLGENPVFLSMLLFKLSEERRKSNELLQTINEKYDRILTELKNRPASAKISKAFDENTIHILPEQDQQIINLINHKGTTHAEEVQGALKYRGKNAASQRLNKLCRDGVLKKIQSGRKVLFTINS
ncbi:MAG: hypothetical protein Q7K42_00385 [Candidatus Diapherotrites archaeon]|nr:hypothetical protein [Candidatus Diapherotrites archaeon]